MIAAWTVMAVDLVCAAFIITMCAIDIRQGRGDEVPFLPVMIIAGLFAANASVILSFVR